MPAWQCDRKVQHVPCGEATPSLRRLSGDVSGVDQAAAIITGAVIGCAADQRKKQMDTTDLVLAILHHLLVFSLAGIIAAEVVLVRNDMTASTVRRLARIDRHYGMVAMLVIVVGAARVAWGLKGWEFYVYNWVFWAKMAAFLIVGLLSIKPTMRFLAWSRQAGADAGWRVPEAELASVRSTLSAEAAVFLAIPVFAAAMARGYGF
jgi:putative membrane protein